MFTCQVVQILNGFIIQLPQSQQEAPKVIYCETIEDVGKQMTELFGATLGGPAIVRPN